MEAIGANIISTTGLETALFKFVMTVEESLEMLGVIIFIYALLDYIAQNMPEIVFFVKKNGSSSTLTD